MDMLVTGSSGQLGSFICEELRGRHDVVGLDIRKPTIPSVTWETRMCDIRDPRRVDECIRGSEVIIHCAAQVSVERSIQDPVGDLETNVLGTVNLLHSGVRAGIHRFVYVSSAAVYGNPRKVPIDESHPTDPISNYGASKLAGEKFALSYTHTSPLEVTVVRPFNFYSPRADPDSPYSGVITKFVSRVSAGRAPVIEGDGVQTRDFIHARDVARMIRATAEKDGLSGRVLNCGSGRSTSVLELANIVIQESGKELKPEFTEPRKGDIRHSLADVSLATKLLLLSPETTLRQGIAELLSR